MQALVRVSRATKSQLPGLPGPLLGLAHVPLHLASTVSRLDGSRQVSRDRGAHGNALRACRRMADRASHASPGPSRRFQIDSSTATPSSDAGEIEEARAALLGDRYWVQVFSTPAYSTRTSASRAAHPNRLKSSDDEVSQPVFRLPDSSVHEKLTGLATLACHVSGPTPGTHSD